MIFVFGIFVGLTIPLHTNTKATTELKTSADSNSMLGNSVSQVSAASYYYKKVVYYKKVYYYKKHKKYYKYKKCCYYKKVYYNKVKAASKTISLPAMAVPKEYLQTTKYPDYSAVSSNNTTGNGTNQSSGDGWVSLKSVTYTHQSTGYTCGPTSLKMALSDYGMNLGEMNLASYAGSSSSSGTTHSGLIKAVQTVDLNYNKHFVSWDETFSSRGWNGLQYMYISRNTPVILHIHSFLHADSGHFVLLTAINAKLKEVRLYDPSYGVRTVSFSEMESRMNWIVSTGRSSKTVIPLLNT